MTGFERVRDLPPAMPRETPIGDFPRAFAHPSEHLINVRRLIRFGFRGKCSCQDLQIVEGPTKYFAVVLDPLFGEPLQDTHNSVKELGGRSLALETFVVLLSVRRPPRPSGRMPREHRADNEWRNKERTATLKRKLDETDHPRPDSGSPNTSTHWRGEAALSP